LSKIVSVPRPARVPGRGTILSRCTHRRSGYILIATSLALLFLLGAAGLAVDIGRMYITKNEGQAYVDSAALAAVSKLDGTAAGITRAQAAVSANTAKWRFETSPFTNVTTTFSTSDTGTFTATPPNPPTGYYFAKVAVSMDLPMYLIRVVSGPSARIDAVAIAGRQVITHIPGGEFPFSPYTRKGYPGAVPDDPDDPYGFKVGNDYTLHWGAPGNKSKCGTPREDSVPNLAVNGNIRAYCCAGDASSAREAIVGVATEPVTIGQSVPMDNAQRDTLNATIAERVLFDSDYTSSSYAQYLARGLGNRVRVVVVPINGGPPDYIALGFAGFFLKNAHDYQTLNGNDAACAEYIGAWVMGGTPETPGGTGAFKLRLFQ
jgi:Flp pilus assembly protein TadG